MKKTYQISAYNFANLMNEVVYYGLTKTKANSLALSMTESGAKHVKVEIEK